MSVWLIDDDVPAQNMFVYLFKLFTSRLNYSLYVVIYLILFVLKYKNIYKIYKIYILQNK